MPITRECPGKSLLCSCAPGKFLNGLTAEAMRDFELHAPVESFPAGTILFREEQKPSHMFVLLEGQVKLCMYAADGRRLALRIARAGELLGLTAVLCRSPYETTAETQYASKAAVMRSEDFHALLMQHPEAYAAVSCELGNDYVRACERLRTVGLASAVPVRLARLLLEWCDEERTNGCSARLYVPLTHAEIGEFIGASRETVTRTFKDLRDRRLVHQQGSTFTIPDRMALECYAQTQAVMNGTGFSEGRQLRQPRPGGAKGSNSLFNLRRNKVDAVA